MRSNRPRVSVGMPVFQGEPYLEAAIESVLNQEFCDFELIISDNCSTDATEDICRVYAEKDSRVQYERQPRNMGAVWNINHVFEVSTGEYFAWAHADDLHPPKFLSRCVTALDEDDAVVVAHGLTDDIDEKGVVFRHWGERLGTEAPTAHERIRKPMMLDHYSFPVYGGLIRADVLRETALNGPYPSSDEVLFVELVLRGRFQKLSDVLFLRRDVETRATRRFASVRDRAVWYDPAKAGVIVFPAWRIGFEYVRAISRAPLPPRERILCYMQMAAWLRTHGNQLARNIAWAGRELLRRGMRRLRLTIQR